MPEDTFNFLSLTIWAGGRWKVWGRLKAAEAACDPNFQYNFTINSILEAAETAKELRHHGNKRPCNTGKRFDNQED